MLHPNDSIDISVNQGLREAFVLAILDGKALVEYQMPNGTTALRVISASDPTEQIRGRSLAYRSVPIVWLKAILSAGLDWIGAAQQNGGIPVPSVREMLAEKEGELV